MMAGFDKLTLAERANVLWRDGKFLATDTCDNRKVNLYLLNGQLIEMWYDAAGDLIEKIIPISNPELLKKYAEQST